MRILITLLFVAIYRFGSFVVLPGINPAMLDKLQSQTAGGLMSLLDMFSGGAFSNASIFALGIMPYISASIVMQLLAVAVPYFQKMQREGESGRKKISAYTRYLTVAILLFQAPGYLINLKVQAGAALGVALRTKNQRLKETALSAGITGVFAITEPSIYGVNLPLKKPFYIAVVFAAIAGGIAGFGNAAALAGGPVGILSFPLFIGEGFGYFVAAMLIALFGTAIAVYFFGYDKKYDQE